jgi:hypothetical protein
MEHAPPAKWNPPLPPAPPSPLAPLVALAAVTALLVVGAPPAPPLPWVPLTVKQLPATQIPALPEALQGAPSSRDRTTQAPFAVTSQRRVSQTPSPSVGQIVGVSAPHLPVPGSHVGATWQALAAGQTFAGCAHDPPLQTSSVHATPSSHLPAGAGPFSGVHVPSLDAPFDATHAWHGPPLQAASQHTPSTQNPVEHCDAPAHGPPIGCFDAQVPPRQ